MSARVCELDALPLPGGAELALTREGDEIVVSIRLAEDADGQADTGDGAFEGLLALLRDGARCGRFSFQRMHEVPQARGERAIEVDQSNRSVVVGERVVVKVFPRTQSGPQPAYILPAHLASVGFTAAPAPFGSVTWTDEDGRSVLIATASAFLPGARDGWDWYLDLLLERCAGRIDEDAALEPASAVGRLAGELHAAMATPSPVLPSPVGIADRPAIATWKERAGDTLDAALASTAGAEGRELRAREGRIRSAFEPLDELQTTPVMLVHGDLHVGQILRWDGGYAITDFDGNPLASAEVRNTPDSPARDVASLVRSVDHLGRIAQRRGAGPTETIERWIDRSREELLTAYIRSLTAAGHGSVYEPRLLRPLEVAQGCHEYVYAARYLPSWIDVPQLAMRSMFP